MGMHYLHTMVRVTDIEQSLDFFCNKLGMVQISRSENEKGRYTLVFLAATDDVERARSAKAPVVELTYNWDPPTTSRSSFSRRARPSRAPSPGHR